MAHLTVTAQSTGRLRWTGIGAALLAALLLLTGLGPVAQAQPRGAQEPVTLQFLNVSDWHAQLDPLFVVGVGDVGGAAHIASYWAQDRAQNPDTLTLTAGDAYGASPPLSGFNDEVPAVLAMRMMGFDVDTFGNHNFDRGIDHLQRMIDLALAPAGEQPGEPFQYVSANLRNRDDNLTGVKDFEIFDVGGVPVGVVGVTNPEAPGLVFPSNFGTIEVTDPVPAANRARAQARRAGAKVLILISHMGVTSIDEDGNPSGPLIDLAENVGGFDIIFGDHTDFQFEGVINNQLVIENRSKGLTYSRTQLTVDPRNGRVIERSNEFVTPFSDAVEPDQDILDMLVPFREALAEAFDGVIGVATDTFAHGGSPPVERAGEAAIGNLITDALRLRYDTDIAVTNGGGIRQPLPSNYVPQDTSLRRPTTGFAAGPPWDLVVGDVFAVLPFGNAVVTRPVTGAQLYDMLEHGIDCVRPDGGLTCPRVQSTGKFPQVSGFSFTFDPTLPLDQRVTSVTLDDGTSVLRDGTVFTMATNDFMNFGGDGYTMLVDGQGVTREVMADVVVEHIQEQGEVTPTLEGRIIRANGG